MTDRTWEEKLEGWDRHAWMAVHGEWASEAFAERSKARSEAREALARALTAAASAALLGQMGKLDWIELEVEREECEAAEQAMEAAPEGDGDYIAEGTIDPDSVSGWEVEEEIYCRTWTGWECAEGERVLRLRNGREIALAHNWWRRADRMSQRRRRDLWRVLWREEDPEPEPEADETEADEADE